MKQKINHILVIAPAGRVDLQELQKGIELLRNAGFKVETGENINKIQGPFAGRDAERLADLQWALDHPEADAIWMARGGYGLTRIIDNIQTKGFLSKPKVILGFSDITALFLDSRFEKFPLIHSSMIESITKDELLMLKDLLNNKQQTLNCKSNREQSSLKGAITGGNLSLIVNQLGIVNPEFFKGKILFLEEIAEYDYKIDRMIVQLKRAGVFRHVKALLLGAFSETINGRFPLSGVYDSIVEEAKIYEIPCFYDLPSGHIHPNHPLIFNLQTELQFTSGELNIKYLF